MSIRFMGFPRLKPPWGAGHRVHHRGEAAAAQHPVDDNHWLPQLGATERVPDFHLLWQHCMRSQILPDAMKRMRRKDLEYLAAHSGDVFYIMEHASENAEDDEPTRQIHRLNNEKLQANAVRAKYELERRDRVRGVITTTAIAAAIGAVAGGLFASGLWP